MLMLLLPSAFQWNRRMLLLSSPCVCTLCGAQVVCLAVGRRQVVRTVVGAASGSLGNNNNIMMVVVISHTHVKMGQLCLTYTYNHCRLLTVSSMSTNRQYVWRAADGTVWVIDTTRTKLLLDFQGAINCRLNEKDAPWGSGRRHGESQRLHLFDSHRSREGVRDGRRCRR
jgi:hypothetical protein